MKKLFIFTLLVWLVWSCNNDKLPVLDEELKTAMAATALSGSYTEYQLPDGVNYSELPNQDVKNPVTPEKVALGKMLFYETGIGVMGKYGSNRQTYSCSSCHIPSNGFNPGRFQGVADGAIGFGDHGEGRGLNPAYLPDEVDAQGARPLTMHNLTFVTNALWAGSFGSFGTNVGTEYAWHQDSLLEINFLGLQGLEANNFRALQVHRQMMNKAMADSLGYTEMFDKAFPEIPVSERYTLKTSAFAISAYFRTILTNQAPFQLWLRGDNEAMTQQQKEGALVFFGKGGCTNCHKGPALNDMRYVAIGVKDLYQQNYVVFGTGPTDKRILGRGGFTGVEEDNYKFKIPQLYNLKNIGFYFHGASKHSLEEVVNYFDKAVPENPDVPASHISSSFKPLGLTDKEKADLVEFIKNGLYDPNIDRYVPSTVMSGNCFPNNDYWSRFDLGCN